jgi:hypothetical protein
MYQCHDIPHSAGSCRYTSSRQRRAVTTGSVPTSQETSSDQIPHLWQQQSTTGHCRRVVVVMVVVLVRLSGAGTVKATQIECLQLIHEQLAQSTPHFHTALINHLKQHFI